jgi:hypothetical protein
VEWEAVVTAMFCKAVVTAVVVWVATRTRKEAVVTAVANKYVFKF